MIAQEYQIDTETYVHREELRNFYKTPCGIHVLKQKILMCGLLSEISDEQGVMAHNLCIKELEEIGLLDEEGLESLITYLLNRPSTKRPEGVTHE